MCSDSNDILSEFDVVAAVSVTTETWYHSTNRSFYKRESLKQCYTKLTMEVIAVITGGGTSHGRYRDTV